MENNGHVTKKDLQEFEVRMKEAMKELINGSEAKLVEQIRDSQTELLRGFQSYQTSNTTRLRKLEADYTNLDASATIRLANLEERVMEIEKKFIKGEGPKN